LPNRAAGLPISESTRARSQASLTAMKPILISLAAGCCLVAPGPALAASTIPFHATATMHVVKAERQGGANGHYLVRGPVISPKLGRGTGTYESTIKGTDVTGTVVVRFAGGTIRTAMRGQFSLAMRGDVLGRTQGTGRIVRGTGRYRGASGTFTFTGVSHRDGSTDMRMRGRVHPAPGVGR